MANKGPAPASRKGQGGFSLLEIIVVLGIMGVLASFILPNLRLTSGSQIAASIRELTGTMRATFDAAVLTGRVHRLVIKPKDGSYWAEIAPESLQGRPPEFQAEAATSLAAGADQDARTRFLEELDKAAADPRKAGNNGDRNYSQRSVLVVQRGALKPLRWAEVEDPVLYKRQLPGSVVLNMAYVEFMSEKLDGLKASDTDLAYLYYFPWGESMRAVLQIGIRADEGALDETGPKYTLVLDPISGRSELLEGFQEPEWVKNATK